MRGKFAIITILILVMIFTPLMYNQSKMIQSDRLLSEYNEKIDNSVEDAAKELLDNYDSSSIEVTADGNKENYQAVNLNLDKALWRFYKSLYSNFNIENDYIKQQAFKDKIPLKLAVGYDGYYINSFSEETTKSGKKKLIETWSKKINYTLLDNKSNIKIDFTLDDYVYITDLNNKKEYEGKQSQFASQYPDSIFGNKDKFDGVRRQTITNLIENDLKYYTSVNNKYSKEYGLGYTFTVPYIDNTAINDVSFIAFIQGVPIEGVKKVYNSFSLGIARVNKKEKWYGYIDSGKKYYCKNEQDTIGGSNAIFDSAKEAAQNGYYPKQ